MGNILRGIIGKLDNKRGANDVFNKNNKEKKNEKENEKTKIKMILPLYLNQRFIYDILAVKNDGFTEFFEIKDKDQKNMEMKGKIDGSFGTNNKFSLIQANMNTSLNSEMMNNRNNEKSYRKTHTPTSLFMKAYSYLQEEEQIKIINNKEEIKNLRCGDFVQIESSVKFTTLIDMLEIMKKEIELTKLFQSFDPSNSDKSLESLTYIRDGLENLLKVDEKGTKYGIANLDGVDIPIKLYKNYFVNGDYSEISHGKFVIIGKVIEKVEENEGINLIRENSVGVFKQDIYEELRNSAKKIPIIELDKVQDTVKGATIVIMPLTIAI